MLDLLGRRIESTFDVLASHWEDGFGSATILRVYRADVAAGALNSWTNMVEERARALAETAGLCVVLAGTYGPAVESTGDLPIMAVSAWRDWTAVLSATRGHIDQAVLDTDLGELEKPGPVDHYQLLDRESLSGDVGEDS
jgi:hypothetical protein